MVSRSSGLNSRFFDLLTPTATTTSSKRAAARWTMSRWPLVTGSNEPGQTARLTGAPRTPSRRVTVPKRGLAVPLAARDAEPVRPRGLRAARGALDDDHRARDEPA